MMRSLFSGVSGLKAHQTGMDVIGNNIANVNTTGFKSSRATFSDMFSQTLSGASAGNGDVVGGTNPKQIGLGSVVSSIDTLFTDGSPQSTGKNTDMALQGNGLFIVKQGKQTFYTRNGDFQFDKSGNFVNSAGLFVQGWVTDDDGNLPATTNDSNMQNLKLDANAEMKAKATTTATYNSNLNSSAPTIKSMSVLDGNGNIVTVSDPTAQWEIGQTKDSTINTLDAGFAGNITLDSANGQYTMGANYAVSDIKAYLGNGDVILVPSTSNAQYSNGAPLATVCSAINAQGTVATLSDGTTKVSSAGSKLTLANGDTVTLGSFSSTAYPSTGATYLGTVASITGDQITMADSGDVVTNGSGTTYTVALAGGLSSITLTPSSSDGTTYAVNGNLDATVSSTTGTNATLTYTVPGTTTAITLGTVSATGLSVGDKYSVTITGITGNSSQSVSTMQDIHGNTIKQIDAANALNVTYKDGATSTGSGSSYTVTLGNGDTIQLSKGAYEKGSSITVHNSGVNVSSVQGSKVTLSNSDVLTNNSGSTYKAVLANGDTLTISATSTKLYQASTSSSNFVPNVTIKGVQGNLVSLSDGSIIKATSSTIAGYQAAVGKNLSTVTQTSITSITGMPSSVVKSIQANDPQTVTELSGTVASDDSKVSNSFDTKTSGAALKASNGLTISKLTLTDADNDSISISSSDTTSYGKGMTYSATEPKSITLSMSDGTTITENTGAYQVGYSMPVATTMKVFDVLGNEHNVTLYFTKTHTGTGEDKDGNTWTVSINPNGGDSYEVNEPNGDKTTVKMNPVTLQFNPTGTVESGSQQQETLTLQNGAKSPLSITVDFSQLTQYASGSTITNVSDGNASGKLSSVTIDNQGRIIGKYTNDKTRVEGQVAVAQFTNSSGLTKAGNSLYQESNNSGKAKVNNNSELGVYLTTSALEMSNVDIANEFSNMITTQRGFQSNSKIITVSDEMLETLINMKR